MQTRAASRAVVLLLLLTGCKVVISRRKYFCIEVNAALCYNSVACFVLVFFLNSKMDMFTTAYIRTLPQTHWIIEFILLRNGGLQPHQPELCVEE